LLKESNGSKIHFQLSILQGQVPRLAELDPAQSQPERLLHKGAPRAWESGKGQLLDAGPAGGGHVRQRQFPAP